MAVCFCKELTSTFAPVTAPFYILSSNRQEVQVFPTPSPWFSVVTVNLAVPLGVQWRLGVVFISISTMANDVEQLIMWARLDFQLHLKRPWDFFRHVPNTKCISQEICIKDRTFLLIKAQFLCIKLLVQMHRKQSRYSKPQISGIVFFTLWY